MKRYPAVLLAFLLMLSGSGIDVVARADALLPENDVFVSADVTAAPYSVATPPVTAPEPVEFELFTNISIYTNRGTKFYYTEFLDEYYDDLATPDLDIGDFKARIYLSYDGGDTWLDYTNDANIHVIDAYGVGFYSLNEGETYTFKAEVFNDEWQLVARSNPFTFVMPADDDIESVLTGGGRGGDKNNPTDKDSGGDSSAGTVIPPLLSIPASTTRSSRSVSVREEPQAATAQVSLSQLVNLAKVNPKYVTLSRGGIKLEVPTGQLLALQLSAYEKLHVTFEKLSDTRVDIRSSISGRRIQAGLPVIAYFPYTPKQSDNPNNLVLTAPDGKTAGMSFYDKAKKRMVFWAEKPGIYTVTHAKAAVYRDIAEHNDAEDIRFISARLPVPWVKNDSFSPNAVTAQNDFMYLLYAMSNGKKPPSAEKLNAWAKSAGLVGKDASITGQKMTRRLAAQYLCGLANAHGFLPDATAADVFYKLYAPDGKMPQSSKSFGSAIDPAFSPDAPITNAECARIISRFIRECYR